MSGSIWRGSSGTKSSAQALVLACPDCMAVFAGL